MEITIPKYAITGGPVSGKTSLPPFLVDQLAKAGIKAFIVPESATHVFGIGHDLKDPSLQEKILQTQLFFEKQAEEAASYFVEKTGRRAIIYCDRGIFDSKAYMSEKKFKALLEKYKLDYVHTRDQRYKGIIHLDTTAKGKEEIYLKEFFGNPHRSESLEEARRRDDQVKQSWNGAPHIWAIDNSTGFDEKKQRAVNYILHMEGMPEPKEIEFKYLIDPRFKRSMIKEYRTDVSIEQTYLSNSNPNIEERIRKRGQYNSFVFIHTLKQREIQGEWESFLEASEYKKLLGRRIVEKEQIRKIRSLFMSENQYFEFDTFAQKIDTVGHRILELEVTDRQTTPKLPEWIQPYVVKEVTNDPFYSNSNIASRLYEAKKK